MSAPPAPGDNQTYEDVGPEELRREGTDGAVSVAARTEADAVAEAVGVRSITRNTGIQRIVDLGFTLGEAAALVDAAKREE